MDKELLGPRDEMALVCMCASLIFGQDATTKPAWAVANALTILKEVKAQLGVFIPGNDSAEGRIA